MSSFTTLDYLVSVFFLVQENFNVKHLLSHVPDYCHLQLPTLLTSIQFLALDSHDDPNCLCVWLVAYVTPTKDTSLIRVVAT